jgi:hypothetical protein
VEGIYNRADLIELRRGLLEKWAGFCGAPETANVVPLRRTASGSRHGTETIDSPLDPPVSEHPTRKRNCFSMSDREGRPIITAATISLDATNVG